MEQPTELVSSAPQYKDSRRSEEIWKSKSQLYPKAFQMMSKPTAVDIYCLLRHVEDGTIPHDELCRAYDVSPEWLARLLELVDEAK